MSAHDEQNKAGTSLASEIAAWNAAHGSELARQDLVIVGLKKELAETKAYAEALKESIRELMSELPTEALGLEVVQRAIRRLIERVELKGTLDG